MSDNAVVPEKRQRGIQSLETGGAILKAMCAGNGPMKLRDIADQVGMLPSQLHPYLVSLRAVGLVEQGPTGHYELGAFSLQLGLARLTTLDPYQVTIRHVGGIVDTLGCMVAISVWGDHGPTIVYMQEGPRPIHAMFRLGSTFAMNISATARLFAALAPSDHVLRLSREAWHQQAQLARDQGRDEDWLEGRLREIRQRRFDTAVGSPVPGINAIAVPVLDHQSNMRMAVTAIAPSAVLDNVENGAALEFMRSFSHAVSAELGNSDHR